MQDPEAAVAGPSLEDSSSLIEKALMLYMNNFFTISATRSLEFSDLGNISRQDASATGGFDSHFININIALEEWQHQMSSKPRGERSIFSPLYKIVGGFKFLLLIFLNAVIRGFNYIPVLILGELVNHLSGVSTLSTAMLWILVVSLLLVPIIGILISAQSLILQSHLGVQFKVALINLIYEKSMKMSTAAKSQEDGASTGQVVTMFSNDTMMMQQILFAISDICILPITIAIGIYLVYREVGVSTFVGLALFVVGIPPTLFIFVLLSIFRMQKLVFTDERVKLMNELLTGIRIVKLSSWEKAFSAVILHIRLNELKVIRKTGYSLAFGISLILNAVPVFIPILVFYTYIRLGNNLTTAKAFVTISLFALIKWPLVQLPGALSHLNLAAVSMKRIARYLESEELESYVGTDFSEDAAGPGDGGADGNKAPISVQVIDATLGWIPPTAVATVDAPDTEVIVEAVPQEKADGDGNGGKYAAVPSGESGSEKDPAGLSNRSVYTLLNVNLTIRTGSLVAVVGPVGSGKSSLLCALLGELHRHKGKVSMVGSVAYCDQRSWINNDTVEGNILLGQPCDEEKLNRAIYASCLDDDIKVLSGGLKTQIGEKGVNLSGGQKARVSFARAVYADSDVYLLDDPLSAVDAHVGQFLFRETICNILKSKTRILVTHQLQYLPYCDQIIAFRDGAVAFSGNYDDFVKSSEFVPIAVSNEKDQSASNDENETSEGDIAGGGGGGGVVVKSRGRLNSGWGETRDAAVANASQSAEERKTDQRSSTITTVEERDEGFIDNSVYYAYAKAGGLGIAAVVVTLMSISQLFGIGGLFWLSMWGSRGTLSSSNGDNLITQDFSNEPQIFFLNVLALINFIALIFTVAAIITQVSHRLGASLKLYMNLLQSILNAPMSFFDSTPIGRILNRFSGDTSTIDEMVADNTYLTMDALLSVCSALLAIAIATTGTFLLLLVPLVITLYRIARYYRLVNTGLSRLESVSRSPVYADFSQMLVGLISIRAYRKQTAFFVSMQRSLDIFSLTSITVNAVSMWLMIRLDFLTSLISFFIAVIAVTAGGVLSPQYLGLALSYSFQLNETSKTLIRMVGMLDAGMNGVERIRHYTNNIPQEKQTIKDGAAGEEGGASQIPESWPSSGHIVAEDAKMRYRDGPLVLKGLSFTIQPGEKIGIVGRTGSGKSSMMNAIFRIEELVGGRIIIDGLDIATVPLKTLRSTLGIIPQDSVMFSETVRFNLDPFKEHSDEDIMDVLESINMKNTILNLPNKLDEKVAEGGDNFSAGQRQLLCIARTILRKPKILILDEATASVDNDADNLVQNVIRSKAFKDSTVLTIAHRLHTIRDCDKIMVLSDGRLCEMDTPEALLAKPDGLFAQLWAQANKQRSRSEM